MMPGRKKEYGQSGMEKIASGTSRSKLPLYIVFAGWLGLGIYLMISIEAGGQGTIMDHFLSPDRSGIRFRALVLFAPFLSTIIGYMVYLREKFIDSLESANKQLEEHLEEREELITKLGHDIKTPLTPLVNLLPLARKSVRDENVGSLLDVTIQNANYLKDLVLKTLELARASRKYTQYEVLPFMLHEVVEHSVNKASYLINEKKIEIMTEVPDGIILDASRQDMESLLGNLLSNAIKFSEPGGVIIISAERAPEGISVSVRDFGMGLRENEEQKIFDSFYKSDESRHDLESTGLGLSICKKVVENHGGSIWAESPGEFMGTKVNFSISKDHLHKEN